MAYQTGTATDQHNLLDQFRAFLAANGWTVNSYEVDLSSYNYTSNSTAGYRLHASRSGVTISLRSCVRAFPFEYHSTSPDRGVYRSELTGIAAMAGTGYDAGQSWDYQPGAPVTSAGLSVGVSMQVGGCTYHFFSWADGPGAAMAVEASPGNWQHLVAGRMLPQGAVAGGEFCAGSREAMYANRVGHPFGWAHESPAYSTALVAATVDGERRWFDAKSVCGRRAWWPVTAAGDSAVYVEAWNRLPRQASPNQFNGVGTLLPLPVFVERDGGLYSPLGVVPGVRELDISLLAPASSWTLGSDEWVVFPLLAKTESDTRGIAYLKG